MTQKLQLWGYAQGCPACDKLKQLLDLLSIPYDFREVGFNSPERDILRRDGFTTLPQVFTEDGRGLGDLSDFRKTARLGIQSAGLLG